MANLLVGDCACNPWSAFAFPLKKRFIDEEQLPFPEGYAAGVVLSNLHSEAGNNDGVFKAKLLVVGMFISAFLGTIRNGAVMTAMKLKAFTLQSIGMILFTSYSLRIWQIL